MLKKLILLILAATALTCPPSIFAGERSIHSSVSSGNYPSQAEIDAMIDAYSKKHPLKIPNGGLSELSDGQSQNLRHDVDKFVDKRFFTHSWTISGLKNSPPERLINALVLRMIITGKWSNKKSDVSIDSGIIEGQAYVPAFAAIDKNGKVLAVGLLSVGVGNDDQNVVDIYYNSQHDLAKALPSIHGFARYYVNYFDDPSMPAVNPPVTLVETLYDLGRCLAGTTSKHIDVKTCPKETKTLSVK